MRKDILKRSVSAFALLAMLAGNAADALAQQGSLVQQSGSRLDAGGMVAAGTNFLTISTSSVATTATVAGQYVYVTGLYMATCQSSTAAASVNVSWTTTNLGGATFGLSQSAGVNSCANEIGFVPFSPPLKAAAPGTAVVLTSPSAATNVAHGGEIFYYIAP